MSTPFLGDPQPLLFYKGLYHFYFLRNDDYPAGNGTAWYHQTSPDGKTWTDAGVAIPKYTTGNGDAWSGSFYIDTNNRIGRGADVLYAFLTMPYTDGQGVARWYSTDGYTFTYDQQVLTNSEPTGVNDRVFRDPHVFWSDDDSCFYLIQAEIGEVSIYTSSSTTSWTKVSSVAMPGYGTVERPMLFKMAIWTNGIDTAGGQSLTGKGSWVLFASGNNNNLYPTTTVYYWTGSFSNGVFTADDFSSPQIVAEGSDFYALALAATGNPSGNPTYGDDLVGLGVASLLGVGWMDNWAYAQQFPNESYTGGYTDVDVYKLVQQTVTSNGYMDKAGLRITRTRLNDPAQQRYPLIILSNSVPTSGPIVQAANSYTFNTRGNGNYDFETSILSMFSGSSVMFTIGQLTLSYGIDSTGTEATFTMTRDRSGSSVPASATWTATTTAEAGFPMTTLSHLRICVRNGNQVNIFVEGTDRSFSMVDTPANYDNTLTVECDNPLYLIDTTITIVSDAAILGSTS